MSQERIESDPPGPRPAKVAVRFDQQQLQLVNFLRTEKIFGTTDAEIIRNVVLAYLSQQSEKGAK